MQRNQLKVYWILVIIFTMVLQPCMSAKTGAITDKQWEQLTHDKAFNYKDEKELKTIKYDRETENFASKIIGIIFSFFTTTPGRIIVWLFFFLIIGYALLKIFLNEGTSLFARKKNKIKEDDAIEDLQTEDLLQTNWEESFYQASKTGNTRLAVRYSFMLLLQLMQKKQLIQYRADKTNYDYYYELSNQNVKPSFRKLARQYEYSWYGNYPISPESYEEYMNTFGHIKKQIGHS